MPDSIVNYEDIYYKGQAKNFEPINFKDPKIVEEKNIPYAFETYNVHEREKNILFREFIQLVVWIGYNMDPAVDKPQKSV